MSKIAAVEQGALRRRGASRRVKRSEIMVEEIKDWIALKKLKPGDRLPRELELQALFGLSKGTTREALKSLEVQGLVTLRTGPAGGARITRTSFARSFQLIQNYMFFQELDTPTIYAVRRLLEPELAASATPRLNASAIARLEASIEQCAPGPMTSDQALRQRAEDLHFHDIIAEAAPNALLRFNCQVINEMLRSLIVFRGGSALMKKHGAELGRANVAAHRAILGAIKERDSEKVRRLMLDHVIETDTRIRRMQAVIESRFVLDSEIEPPIRFPDPQRAAARRRNSPGPKVGKVAAAKRRLE